jgi:hypothetical protein
MKYFEHFDFFRVFESSSGFVSKNTHFLRHDPSRRQNAKVVLKCLKNIHNYDDVKLSQKCLKMLFMRCVKMISFQ